MGVAKNHVPLTEIMLIRFNKKDMEAIKKLAKGKRLATTSFIRMVVGDYITKESGKKH